MIFIFISLITLMCVSVHCGELDDFAEDVEFLKSAYKEVKSARRNAPIKVEYTKRIVRAKARASRLQRNLTTLGIHRVTLDSTLKKMLAFMPIDGINSKGLKTEAGSMNMYYHELVSQIKYLKEINYSPENGTVENPYPGSDTYDALNRFESLFKRSARIASSKNLVSPSVKKLFDDDMRDLRSLAVSITRHIRETKLEVPSGFDLEYSLKEFRSAALKSISGRLRREKMSDRDRKRLLASKNHTSASSSVKFWVERIQNEIDYLRKMNLYLRVKKTNLNVIESKAVNSEDEITESSGQPSFEELWKRYSRKKDELYHSESKIRGVTEDFYRKYRALLPPRQQKELDSFRDRNLAQEMPPEFARSSAVKTIHTRYRFRSDAYSAEFLAGILKQ